MADQDQGAAIADIALALAVDLGNQRAGGVQNRQSARRRFLNDRLGHAMGAEHRDRAFGHFVQLFDKAGALVLQRFDDMAVVHDLMAHIDGLAIFFERALDDVDRPHDARTKAARLGKDDTHHSVSRRRPLCELNPQRQRGNSIAHPLRHIFPEAVRRRNDFLATLGGAMYRDLASFALAQDCDRQAPAGEKQGDEG